MTYQEPPERMNDLTYRTIGAAIEVHNQLGPGFLESVYEQAMSIELEMRGIKHIRQYPTRVEYKGHPVGEGRIDILVEKQLVVELKTVETLLPVHKAQVISYLKATNLQLGLLINFKVSVLNKGVQRIVLSS